MGWWKADVAPMVAIGISPQIRHRGVTDDEEVHPDVETPLVWRVACQICRTAPSPPSLQRQAR
jgi:hypothetical protein